MRGRDKQKYRQLDAALRSFHAHSRPLPGIELLAEREAFLGQMLESIHRVEYVRRIDGRDVSPRRKNPNDELFDPIKAAIAHKRAGEVDEACWLVFLSVHFGKHRVDGWKLVQDVYGGLGRCTWDWKQTSASPTAFRKWLGESQSTLKSRKRHFGNHRKYENLDAQEQRGTGAAIESYVYWVNPPRNHGTLINDCRREVGADPGAMFDHLYKSMASVVRFGRTARFDYLTMLGKLNLAPIEPNSTYMSGATGPFSGGNLLFGGSLTAGMQRAEIDAGLRELGVALGVGMQVMEDSLCNWQKSPAKFIPFRG